MGVFNTILLHLYLGVSSDGTLADNRYREKSLYKAYRHAPPALCPLCKRFLSGARLLASTWRMAFIVRTTGWERLAFIYAGLAPRGDLSWRGLHCCAPELPARAVGIAC